MTWRGGGGGFLRMAGGTVVADGYITRHVCEVVILLKQYPMISLNTSLCR